MPAKRDSEPLETMSALIFPLEIMVLRKGLEESYRSVSENTLSGNAKEACVDKIRRVKKAKKDFWIFICIKEQKEGQIGNILRQEIYCYLQKGMAIEKTQSLYKGSGAIIVLNFGVFSRSVIKPSSRMMFL